jgi:hypothetical protein
MISSMSNNIETGNKIIYKLLIRRMNCKIMLTQLNRTFYN